MSFNDDLVEFTLAVENDPRVLYETITNDEYCPLCKHANGTHDSECSLCP